MMNKTAVDNIVTYFETLTEESVSKLSEYYVEDAYFKDPFNEVRGVKHIQHIFAHMYTALDKPRFIITNRIVEDNDLLSRLGFQVLHEELRQNQRTNHTRRLAFDTQCRRQNSISPRLLGCSGRAVRKAARGGCADAVVEETGE